jgi:methylmalonyl-CoA/ethylmalonyl-CoA epimerase
VTDLDHFAIGTDRLADGWELFGGILGGAWAGGGGGARGFWAGSVQFASGPSMELLTPTGGPDAAFLERFLAAHGPGPHHLNFHTEDIEDALARVRALGIEPVGINLDNPQWREAFLHPRAAHGIVIQIAQSDGHPMSGGRPADLPEPGPAAYFDLIEHHVSDLKGAARLFTEVLDGQVSAEDNAAVELSWPGGKVIRLVQPPAGAAPLPNGGQLHHLRFTRPGGGGGAPPPPRLPGQPSSSLTRGMTLPP